MFKNSDWINKITVPVKVKQTKPFYQYIKELFVHYFANSKTIQFNVKIFQNSLNSEMSQKQIIFQEKNFLMKQLGICLSQNFLMEIIKSSQKLM